MSPHAKGARHLSHWWVSGKREGWGKDNRNHAPRWKDGWKSLQWWQQVLTNPMHLHKAYARWPHHLTALFVFKAIKLHLIAQLLTYLPTYLLTYLLTDWLTYLNVLTYSQHKALVALPNRRWLLITILSCDYIHIQTCTIDHMEKERPSSETSRGFHWDSRCISGTASEHHQRKEGYTWNYIHVWSWE